MAINDLRKRRQQQLQKLGDLAPRFSPAMELGARGEDLYFHVFPFRRSLPVIVVTGGMLAAFSIPLLSIGATLTGGGDELFSFVSMAFSLFWLLGWSVGVIALALAFLVLLVGRETLHVTQDSLILRVGLPGLGLGLAYPRALIRNFREADAGTDKGSEWRGEHLLFDFAGQPEALGCNISGKQAAALLARLKELFPDQALPLPDLSSVYQAQSADFGAGDESPLMSKQTIKAQALPAVAWYSPSALALIAANLVPLVGVVIAGWNVGDLMLLFWAESAVIGVYNLLKMARVAGWAILFLGPFFVGHYGGFMVGHLLFIYTLFINGLDGGTDIPLQLVLQDFVIMAPALLAFVISHGVSYTQNFLGRKEYLGRDANTQMGEPYKRIIIMHVTIIFGGFLVMALGSALPALLLLIALKLGADLYAHLNEHRGGSATDASPAPAV